MSINWMYGTTGADALVGGKGDDGLIGGPGDDTLTGGLGQDVFWLSLNGGGDDLITDYKGAGGHPDKIVFDGWGLFTSAPTHTALADGMTFTTEYGHVLTVADTGADVTLTWDTGDSFTVQGVDPGDIFADSLSSYRTYDFVW